MKIRRDVLEPVDGFSPDLGLCVARLEEVRAQTVELLEDMTPEELAKKISPELPQIGGLALHLGECQFWWIEAALAKNPITEEDVKFAHLHDTTTTDFALKNYAACDTVDILKRIHLRTLATLGNYTDSDLDTVFTCDDHPDGFEGSLRWILHHLVDHESNHRGQMAMIKRIIRSG